MQPSANSEGSGSWNLDQVGSFFSNLRFYNFNKFKSIIMSHFLEKIKYLQSAKEKGAIFRNIARLQGTVC